MRKQHFIWMFGLFECAKIIFMLSTHKEHVVGLFYEHLPLGKNFPKINLYQIVRKMIKTLETK